MITEQQYIEAKKIVDQWIDAQPSDAKFPYKPKHMGIEDYARQRALNEILRLFKQQGSITFDEFGQILNRFDLSIFSAFNHKNEQIIFIKWGLKKNAFTQEKVKNNYKEVIHMVNMLHDNDTDGNSINTNS